MYELLGSLWLEQYKIEWEALTPKQHCHLLELPTYAFDRQSYWLERTFNEIQPDSTNPKKREDFNTWFYSPSWIKLSENNQNNLDRKKEKLYCI